MRCNNSGGKGTPLRRDPFNKDTTVLSFITSKAGTKSCARSVVLPVYNWSQYYWSLSQWKCPDLAPIVLDLVTAYVNDVVNPLDPRFEADFQSSKILEGWLVGREVSKVTWGVVRVIVVVVLGLGLVPVVHGEYCADCRHCHHHLHLGHPRHPPRPRVR